MFWDVLGLGYIGCQGESLVRREQGLYSGLRVCYLRQGARVQDFDFGFKVEGLWKGKVQGPCFFFSKVRPTRVRKVRRSSGPLVLWPHGPLVPWSFGPRSSGPLVLWALPSGFEY